MFVEPKYRVSTDEKIYFSALTEVTGDMAQEWMLSRIETLKKKCGGTLCKKIIVESEIPESVILKIPEYEENDEGFVIEIGEETRIYAKPQAVHSAFAMLEQLDMESGLTKTLLWDKPFCSIRGYRLYTPAREQIGLFKQTIDMLEFYRFNAVIIEVGGAMEYKSHPEINESWVEFCKDMRSKSGRSLEIQERTFDWQKNSIHADNSLGGYLTQDEMRDLVEYCKAHGIEAIPEMPSLSHSDYLLLSHPELAERAEDPYPDTYCPSNPQSYELLFDLLREVIEVFKPSIINIGHDEYYSIALCDKCKDIPAYQLFADDVIKIHDFLAEYGIKTMMWGDKLLNILLSDGEATGGAEIRRLSLTANPKEYYIPPTYKARDLLPKDIIILNWSYSFGREHDEELLKRGFDVVFSNLDIYNITEWNNRIKAGVKGGFVSNWGSVDNEAMQRNGQIIMLLSAAYAFWSDKFDSTDNEALFEKIIYEASRYCNRNIKNPITITHTTNRLMKKYVFYDGIVIEDRVWKMGNYIISYSDSTKAELPVYYGYNISNRNLKFDYKNLGLSEVIGASLPMKKTSKPHKPITFTVTWLQKPPEICENEVDYEMYYTCVYENPYPDKQIVDISYKPCEEIDKTDLLDDPLVEAYNDVTILECKY